MKRILVTGGCGFIGSHASLNLLENGYELIIIDSLINSSFEAIKNIKYILKKTQPNNIKNLNFIKGDIRDENLLNKIFSESQESQKKIDAVIHFAGLKSVRESVLKPLNYWDVNLYGTINLLKIMQRYDCKNFIFSSSATIFRPSEDLPFNEDSEIKPFNPYGKTKSTVEQILNDLFESKDKSWKMASLRYFNPIGAHPSGLLGEDPKDIPNNIFPLINKVASREIKTLKIFGNDWDTKDGTGVRDYIHVMDISEGHLNALEFLLKNEPKKLFLNFGTGKGTSVLELIKTFEKVNNIKIPYIYEDRREGDIACAFADNSLAKNILNWEPKRNLEDMCKDGWNWYLNSKMNRNS
tara:strand:- start:61 stop:1119 length:1059 start_codon:yes stop_codon:yes gene_type:complete